MKSTKGLLVVGLLALLGTVFGGAAFADTIVTFSTVGTLGCGAASGCVAGAVVASQGGNAVTITSGLNHLTISFLGANFGGPGPAGAAVTVGPLTDLFPATTADFGQISTSFTPIGGPPVTITSPLDFSLQVFQSAPNSGNGTFLGTITGTIGASTAVPGSALTFSLGSTTLNFQDVTYQLAQNTWNLVPQSTGSGKTTINGTITAVPEPASLALLGTGLLAGGTFVRRKLIVR